MKIRKMDAAVILLFLSLAGAFYGLAHTGTQSQYAEKTIVIYSENQEYQRIDIEEGAVKTMTVSNQYGETVLKVEKGGIRIIDSDCPDQVCMKEGLISQPGQTLVCLPHKLVVEVIGEETKEGSAIDAVAY